MAAITKNPKNKFDSSKYPVLPDNIKKRKIDSVRYAYSGDNKKWETINNNVCYAKIMGMLTSNYIKCMPHEEEHELAIDGPTYLKWLQLCKQHKLLAAGVEFSVNDEGNQLFIPKNDENDRHIVYTTLCCYRFSESFAPMVWTVVNYLEANPKLTFWQVLHYAMCSQYSYGSGHNFCDLSTIPQPYSNSQKNIGVTLSMKYLFSLSGEQRRNDKDLGSLTVHAVSNISEKIGATDLFIRSYDDILDEKWSALYEVDANKDKTNFQKTFKKLCSANAE